MLPVSNRGIDMKSLKLLLRFLTVGGLVLLLLIPCVNVIIAIITTFKLARSFSKSFWFGLGLFFLSPIFLGILAFGEPRYHGVPEKDTSFAL